MRSGEIGHYCAVALLVGGCGGDGSGTKLDSDAIRGAQRDTGSGAAPNAAAAEGPPLGTGREPNPAAALVGHYAMRAHSTTQANALGMELTTLATSYLLVDIFERDGVTRWTELGCRTEIRNEPKETVVRMTDEAIQLAPALEAELVTSVRDGVLTWERAEASLALGFRDNDVSMAVPNDASDTRVYDQDQDGKPGVTVHVETVFLGRQIKGATYNAQRAVSSMRGTFDGTRLEGEGFFSTFNEVLGATDPVLKFQLTVVRDDSGQNDVLLVPLAGGMGCAQLLSQLDTLFPE